MFAPRLAHTSSSSRPPPAARPGRAAPPPPVESAWHHLATATIPVSRPQDAAEREADRVADAVMAGEAPATRERNSAGAQPGGVREGRGSHTVGTEPVIDFVGYWRGTPVEIIVDVPTRVVRRTFFPSGSTAETATNLVIHYELLIGIRFTRIPGGGALERGRVVRYALPWGGPGRR